MAKNRDAALQAIRQAARPLRSLHDTDALLDLVGDARIVLLGASTHGSQEFCRLRAELTRRLIVDKHFDAVAMDADWAAALRASRWAQGRSADAGAPQALGGFEHFPRWTWRNTEVRLLLEWLRAHNADPARASPPVGLFGLDLYSLRESLCGVLHYLDEVDPEAARRVRARYACFDDFAHHPQAWGHAVNVGLRPAHEREAAALLAERLRQPGRALPATGAAGADERFYAQHLARVEPPAEAYYRTLFASRTEAWNARERHLAATLQALCEHLSARRGHAARVVVWTHNAHGGDARATEGTGRGQLSVGQLVREGQPAPGDTFLLGFTTHAGTVAAASGWDAPAQPMALLPSRIDSVERLLHESGLGRFVLPLTRNAPQALRSALLQPRLERAVGVVYRPGTERWSHYVHASLADRFDAVLHLDQTHALHPLEAGQAWEAAGTPRA